MEVFEQLAFLILLQGQFGNKSLESPGLEVLKILHP